MPYVLSGVSGDYLWSNQWIDDLSTPGNRALLGNPILIYKIFIYQTEQTIPVPSSFRSLVLPNVIPQLNIEAPGTPGDPGTPPPIDTISQGLADGLHNVVGLISDITVRVIDQDFNVSEFFSPIP